MDYQQPRSYMRPPPPPPPPSTVDPYQRPPPPPNQPWSSYSAPQFHYQPQLQHSPSPPPQWPPPPPPLPPPAHSSDHSHYPPYPAHQPPYPVHPHYPPAHPLPPRPPHVPHSYPQNWENASWGHNQNWEYQAYNNEEDWATKARAWAAAKAATENQLPQSQVAPLGRPEEQNNIRDQYSLSVDTQFIDVQQPFVSASSYQHYPVGTAHPFRTPLVQSQEPPFISSGQSSYAMDMHFPPYTARDGNFAGDTMPFTQQEKSSISSLVHQQEVPSSYSSIAGKDSGDINGEFNRSSSLPPVASVSQLYVQSLPPAVGRSGWMEEPHYSLGGQQAESATDLSNQPLNFAPHFNRNQDPHMQSHTHSSGGPARAVDPVASIPTNYAWAPAAASSEGVYPSVPPTIPSGPQVDHSMFVPSPASGHSTPMFQTGASFQPTGPGVGASFGVGTGSALHPTIAFNGDAFGVSERPRKASVPNWLREEIIKNKASMPSSVRETPKEDSQSVEEESIDKTSRRGGQADSKSIDSSRSTEDEDEDEDEVEAARSAAINQEIKRVLTEVLLKVTDELFDEIATKVLNEDGLTVEVDHDTDLLNHKVLPSTPAGSTPKVSAKVLIPSKTKETVSEDASEKSATAGNVLGLASYASDDEEEEIQSSGKLESKENSAHEQSISSKVLKETAAVQLGVSKEESDEHGNILTNEDTDGISKMKGNTAGANLDAASTELNGDRAARELVCSDNQRKSKTGSGVAENEMQHVYDTLKSKETVIEESVETVERRDRNSKAKKSTRDDLPSQHTRHRSDKNDRSNNKNNHTGKYYDREVESFKERVDKKRDEDHRRHGERHTRNERTDDCNVSEDKVKGLGRSGEKVRDSESRKRRLPPEVKEGRQQTDRDKSSSKEDNERRHRTNDELRERSRHKNGSDSSRYKRRRSSSVDGRVRESKDKSVVSHANNSSDESTDDSKRKLHHPRKRKSPSPVRSRKGQVSRSPRSEHSQRRHSSYSSLESTRGRSRSRSPVRRKQ
ncbi:transcription elongation regulator 1 isoform X2 [Olea europaea var. sylvestris]|uniref:Uncharacterized protein n=1 Tax=Olea europaea subsp. europaea TaxID=158383 RepID=A0A8S0UPW8_OLEEU|nr:transcription elongation regulator 1 isoform X2 [Olea europaea var. sylvestris]CAA3020303.1 Hypothetical predicted protein [Olea europaea subsp. europaea]